MNVRQAVVIAVLLLVGAGLIGGTAVGITTSQTSNDGMGVQVSSFAQATAADANSSVDSGMWEAKVNQSENPEEVIEKRVDELEQRLEKLRNQSEELNGTGNGSAVAAARASAVRARIGALQSTLNRTADTARAYGVNETKLELLKSEASNMTGPEVAAIARNITDAPRGPPEDVPGNGTGPPDDAGPGNETGPPDDAGPGNETGPPDDAGPGNESTPGNGTGPGNETGPPEDGGPGNESGPGNGTGPPEDGGPGNETGPGNGTGPPEDGGAENGTGPGNGNSDDGTEETTSTGVVGETTQAQSALPVAVRL